MSNIKLEIDPIIHDMSLAKDFLKENNNEFDFILSRTIKDSQKHTFEDGIPYKVFLLREINILFEPPEEVVPPLSLNRQRLCEILTQNGKLFAQLEYMIRNIPEDETMANLKLIQHCVQTPEQYFAVLNTSGFTVFYEQCPLAVLGLVSDYRSLPIILATPQTAAVASLFVQLCRKAGYGISLYFVGEDCLNQIPFSLYNELDRGCTGVVTETADVDTAIDTFLSSFYKKPWSFKQVLVQENVYDSFKESLKWKCKDRNVEQDFLSKHITDMCSEVHHVDKTTFLLDYVGDDTTLSNKDGIILVEAFRTVPELLSLLQVQNAFCLSLWCNDLTTANTIAYSTNAAFTWINDYCSFEGPPELSQTFYSHLIKSSERKLEGRSWPDVEELINKLEGTTGVLQKLKKQLKKHSFRCYQKVSLKSNGLCVVFTKKVDDPVYLNSVYSDYEWLERIEVAASSNRALVVEKPTFEGDLNVLFKFFDQLKVPMMIESSNINQPEGGKYNSNVQLMRYNETKSVWTKFPHTIHNNISGYY